MFETLSLNHNLIPVNGMTTLLYKTRDEAISMGRFAHSCRKGLKITLESRNGGTMLTICTKGW